jgi:hypothetical protein
VCISNGSAAKRKEKGNRNSTYNREGNNFFKTLHDTFFSSISRISYIEAVCLLDVSKVVTDYVKWNVFVVVSS